MPIPGETKRAYCRVCGQETEWEYVVVQLGDCFLGLENAVQPEAHQVRLWRCSCHDTVEGRLKNEFKRKTRPTAAAPM